MSDNIDNSESSPKAQKSNPKAQKSKLKAQEAKNALLRAGSKDIQACLRTLQSDAPPPKGTKGKWKRGRIWA